jgi:hypothetical protein
MIMGSGVCGARGPEGPRKVHCPQSAGRLHSCKSRERSDLNKIDLDSRMEGLKRPRGIKASVEGTDL